MLLVRKMFWPNTTGSVLLSSANETWKCRNTFDTKLFIFSIANFWPIPGHDREKNRYNSHLSTCDVKNLQFLEPAEKGRYEKKNVFSLVSSKNRSGRNSCGFTNSLGFLPNLHGQNPTVVPFGYIYWPSKKIILTFLTDHDVCRRYEHDLYLTSFPRWPFYPLKELMDTTSTFLWSPIPNILNYSIRCSTLFSNNHLQWHFWFPRNISPELLDVFPTWRSKT